MKKFLVILILFLIILFGLVYVDYFNAKANNTFPKLSLKSENEDAYIYTAILYRVLYCKSNKKYMVASYSEGNVCPKNYEYKNGVYVNSLGISISKKDLQMLTNDGVYTKEMIEAMSSLEEVSNAVHVAYNYSKNIYKVVNETESNKIIIFPEFKEENGTFKWVYDEEEGPYYCLSADEKSYAKYENNTCLKYEKFKMDEKWCKSYKNSTLVYDEDVSKYCKEN